MTYKIDPDTVRQSVTELADWSARNLLDDQRERTISLARLALVRPILYTHTHQLFPKNLSLIPTTRFQPAWVSNAMQAGEKIYTFDPTDKTRFQIVRVADWIVDSIVGKAPWLSDLAPRGRPKSLLAFSSLEHAVHHAKATPTPTRTPARTRQPSVIDLQHRNSTRPKTPTSTDYAASLAQTRAKTLPPTPKPAREQDNDRDREKD
jgi:hypothetical protein